MGQYVDYLKMTPDQKKQVRDHLLTKSLTGDTLHRWRFEVGADGRVTRRKGRHTETAAYRAELDDMLARAAGAPAPSKDQPIVYGSGARFSFSNK